MSDSERVVITLLVGENDYQKQLQLAKLSQGFDEVEKIDGEALDEETWARVNQGQDLFSSKRLFVISELSKNSQYWQKAAELSPSGSELVLLEVKPDKRTKTYKTLVAQAKVIECPPLNVRDTRKALVWLGQVAKSKGIAPSQEASEEIVNRAVRQSEYDNVAIIDQMLIMQAVSQLKLLNAISLDDIDTVMVPSHYDNIFELMSVALKGDQQELMQKIDRLSASQDGYMAMGLLASQLQQLAGLVYGTGRSNEQIAKDLGVHPYALSKLSGLARSLTSEKLLRIIEKLALADMQIKTKGVEPWLAIKGALINFS